jgi:hypothetical protein
VNGWKLEMYIIASNTIYQAGRWSLTAVSAETIRVEDLEGYAQLSTCCHANNILSVCAKLHARCLQFDMHVKKLLFGLQ